jgi:hypothetical protein
MLTYLKSCWHAWQGYRSFRVVYKNGDVTRRLPYSEAKELTGIWKGRIEFDPTEKAK